MWNSSNPEAVTLRARLLTCDLLEEMTVDALTLMDALDSACDTFCDFTGSEAYINWQDDDWRAVYETKMRDVTSDFIVSLLLYGNIAPIVISRGNGELIQGDGHHRMAVLAHWGMPIKIIVNSHIFAGPRSYVADDALVSLPGGW